MEAPPLSSLYAGADGVSVKFRSTVPPNEKRAAVRAALERMDAEEAAAGLQAARTEAAAA